MSQRHLLPSDRWHNSCSCFKIFNSVCCHNGY